MNVEVVREPWGNGEEGKKKKKGYKRTARPYRVLCS